MRTKLESARRVIEQFVTLTKARNEAEAALAQLAINSGGLDLAEEPDSVREAREIQEFEDAVVLIIAQQQGSVGKNNCDNLINAIKRIRRPRDD